MNQNPFQRDTNAIKQKLAITDLNNIRKIMLLSQEKRFIDISEYINQITDNPEKIYFPEILREELKFLQLFYDSLRTQQVHHDQNEIQGLNFYKFRILELNINMKIKNGLLVSTQQIEKLLDFVREEPSLKEEVMMRTVGCASITRLINISKEQIEDLTPNLIKKAAKYQIASQWKFFVGIQKQAITFKKLAIKIWDEIGRVDRADQARQELQQLEKLCQNIIVNTIYANKIISIRKIVVQLQKLPQLGQKQAIFNRRKKTTLKLLLPKLIQDIQLHNVQQNSKENQSKSLLKQARLNHRKQGIIDQRRQIGKAFVQKHTKNNYAYSNYLPENRFQTARIMQFQRILGVLDRIYKKILRLFMNNIEVEQIRAS